MLRPSLLKIKNIISFKETTFGFYEGQAVIIVGDNKDNPSQKGNGSGKSALLETLALAFTGSSVRDVKTRELINNEAEQGELDLTLEDDNRTLRIFRRIYASQSKSADYQAWINGKDQSDHYADFNSFNTWVFKQIGISKEDFFSFFLLTRNTYSAFLTVGDTKKKEIINRFSGADKIDKVFPLIETDSNKKNAELQTLNTNLTSNKSKQEVYAEQIQEEKDKVSEEDKAQRIQDIEEEIVTFEETEKNYASIIEKLTNRAAELEKEIKAFKYTKKYDAEILKLQETKTKVESELAEARKSLTTVKEKFNEQLQAIADSETEHKQELADTKKTLAGMEELESELAKSLLDLIECPKCKHRFLLRDDDFDAAETEVALEETKKEIGIYKELVSELSKILNEDLQQQRSDINAKIVLAQKKVQDKITELVTKTTGLNDQITELQKAKKAEDQALEDKKTEAKTKANEAANYGKLSISNMQLIAQKREAISAIREEKIDKDKTTELESKINELVLAEEKLNVSIESKTKEKMDIDAWEIHFKNFKSHLANKSIKNIQDYTNLFLESMGTDLAIAIDGYKTLANKKIKEQITVTVLRDGFDEGSYGKFSGGERGRIDICVILAMQELINLNSPTGGLDLLIVDEVLDQVDSLGLEFIVLALQGLGKTIMLVSQNEINALNDYTITVRKEGKVSTIL